MYLMGILLFLYQGGIDTSIILPLVTARKKNFQIIRILLHTRGLSEPKIFQHSKIALTGVQSLNFRLSAKTVGT